MVATVVRSSFIHSLVRLFVGPSIYPRGHSYIRLACVTAALPNEKSCVLSLIIVMFIQLKFTFGFYILNMFYRDILFVVSQ